LERKGHVVIEAGTGAGKTVSSLVPTIKHALSTGMRVLYLTRTNSQQIQVIKEFRSMGRVRGSGEIPEDRTEPSSGLLEELLNEVNGERPPQIHDPGPISIPDGLGLCISLQGRSNMCPLVSDDPEFMAGTPDELSRMCSERKRNTLSRASGKPINGPECRFYSAFLLDEGRQAKDWARANIPTAEEMAGTCISMGICPYETVKGLLKEAKVVCAPYIFFFSPFIRKNLLDWMDCSLSDLIVIVDEAHNLVPFARDIGSMDLSNISVRLALSELDSYGDHRVSDRFTIASFLNGLNESISSIATASLVDEDGLIPPSSLTEEMMIKLSTNSARLDSVASEVLSHGEAIRERKKAQGKLPRSYIHSCAAFFLAWNNLEFESFTPLVTRGRREDMMSLEAFAMDPSVLTGVLAKVSSSIHLSGTLSPLEEYRDSVGLPQDSELVRLPPPFPLSNRLVIHDIDLSTNHERLMKDPSTIPNIRNRLRQALSTVKGKNAAVFFPSFDLLREVMGNQELEDGDSLPVCFGIESPLFMERRGSSQSEVMDLVSAFKESRGGVLASVIGGRLSEGMDYPGESLEAVVIVGIPYPRPTARQRAVCAYYDMRFRKGWEYTVHAPAARRILQAMGRMIRSED